MAKLAKSKTATDDTPVAPKDISGDVTNANVIGDSDSPRSKRKRAGDFFDFEEDEAVTDGAGKGSKPTSTQPKKKKKTSSASEKKARSSKDDEKTTPVADSKPKPSKGDAKKASAAKEKADPKNKDQATPKADKKKTKPSKEDGHPVVTGKSQPGGDMVETEPEPQSKPENKHERKTGKRETAAKKGTNSDEKNTASSKGAVESAKDDGVADQLEQAPVESKSQSKNKARSKAGKKSASRPDGDNTDAPPSQARAIQSISAPKGREAKGKHAESKTKASNPDTTADSEAKDDTSGKKAKAPRPSKVAKASDKTGGTKPESAPTDDSAPRKAKASRAAKAKDAGEAKEAEAAPKESSTPAPDQAMDQTPFKKLLKGDRAKITGVKASADAAEAAKKANAATNTDNPVGTGKKVSGAKGAKATLSKEFETAAAEPAAAASSKADPPKGKKRKGNPTSVDTKLESGPSEKKTRKARKSALDVATGAVEDLVHAGIEVAEQGVNAVKDLASGWGDKSIADDLTAVAEGAVEEKSKENKNGGEATEKKDEKPKQSKGKGKGKGKGKAVESDAVDKGAVGEDTFDENASDLDDSEDEDNFEEGDQTLALIQGFESDEEDGKAAAAPGESADGFKEGMEVPQLPTDKGLTQKLEAAKDESKDGPGVVYVGRIPHGFYEPQMRAYFSQFGSLLRLRLSRNRTTGASKHYAFLEFTSAAVAAIVADTMDNYLMFGHILKVRVVPREQVHENMWKGAGKRFKSVPWARIEGRKLERGVGREQWGKRVEAERKRRGRKGEKAREEMGYEFEVPGVKGVEEKTVVTTDGQEGTVIVSEEVKVKKVKKAGKRKVEEKDGEEAKEAKKAKTSNA
ncbi:MAG: hypothetical protein LQ344_001749 [Seirophora lacunosa]|nr:MAG: hypothetical protein LQ344_001749 [Seirophora lacunosa]